MTSAADPGKRRKVHPLKLPAIAALLSTIAGQPFTFGLGRNVKPPEKRGPADERALADAEAKRARRRERNGYKWRRDTVGKLRAYLWRATSQGPDIRVQTDGVDQFVALGYFGSWRDPPKTLADFSVQELRDDYKGVLKRIFENVPS